MRRFTIVLGSLFLVIALSAAVSTAAQKHATESAASPQVVLDWNATAVATTIAAGKSQPESGLYVGLTQAAIYDAVIAIDGGLHPYLIVPGVPPGSSDEAAAAAAAYGVLVGYFPAQKPALRPRLQGDAPFRCPQRVASHAGADGDRVVLDRERGAAVQPGAPHLRLRPSAEPAGRRTGTRDGRHDDGRLADRLLGRENHVCIVA